MKKNLCKFIAAAIAAVSVCMFNATAWAADAISYSITGNWTKFNVYQGTKNYLEKDACTLEGVEADGKIYVDATSGKLAKNNNENLYQMNAGTMLYIPVVGISSVSFEGYSAVGYQISDLNQSEDITSNSKSFVTSAKYYEGATLSQYYPDDEKVQSDTTKYVRLKALNNDYIYSTFKTYTKEGTSAINATGSVTGLPEGCSIIFKNTVTLSETEAVVNGDNYSASLYKDCEYKVTAVDQEGQVKAEAGNITFASESYNLSFSESNYAELTANIVIPPGVSVSLIPSDGSSETLYLENGKNVLQLIPNTNYTVTLSGDTVDEYEVKSDKVINISSNETKTITVDKVNFVNISGSITCDKSDVLTTAEMKFVDGNYCYTASISDGTYSASVCPGKTYNVKLAGTDDYQYDLTDYTDINVLDANVSKNLAFEKVSYWDLKNTQRTYSANTNIAGKKYRGLEFSGYTAKAGSGYVDMYGNGDSHSTYIKIPVSDDVSSVNIDYSYGSGSPSVSVEGSTVITLSKGDSGTYKYALTSDDITKGYVTFEVNGESNCKVYVYGVSLVNDSITYEGNEVLEVGEGKSYTTVSSALDAVSKMTGRGESDVVTIKVDPGVYREKQIIINEPNVKLVNAKTPSSYVYGKSEEAVKSSDNVVITGYYGYGCLYKSLNSDGYYSPSADDNGYDPASWGVVFYVNSGAKNFSAQGITFENSYNIYVTDEEKEDITGASENESYSKVAAYAANRKENSVSDADVQSKAYTERAAAVILDAENTSFERCAFISSQDTLFTSNKNTSAYGTFSDCFVQGNTDYICGDGKYDFNSCRLVWGGYSDNASAGYITASKTGAVHKFINCTIENSSLNGSNKFTPGYFGRPWGNMTCKVMFINCSSENTINAYGWSNWDSTNTAEGTKGFIEYSLNADDSSYDVLRKSKLVSALKGLIRNKVGNDFEYTNKDYELAVIGGLGEIDDSITHAGFIYTTDSELADKLKYNIADSVTSDSNTGIFKTEYAYKDGVSVKFSNSEDYVTYVDNGIFDSTTKYYFADGINLSSILTSSDKYVYIIPYIIRDNMYYCSVCYTVDKNTLRITE